LASATEIDETATNVDLHLPTALTLSGSVRDPGGGPVTNADILFYIGRCGLVFMPQQRTPVDAQGAFSISDLAPGQPYSFRVFANSYGNILQRVAAEETQTVSLQLPPITLIAADQRLEGHVVDARDRPVERTQVNLDGTNQPSCMALTDSKGYFVFKQVCEGPVSLYAYYMDGRVGGVVPSAHVQAQGGDTNILVKLVLTNSTAAAIPGVNGPVPTNGPPPAPPQPQCGHEISSHPCQSLGERGILASRGRRLAGHFFRIE
jgi:hypothetical protein